MKFTTRPQENLVVGMGICSLLPEDHKIHDKIFDIEGKIFYICIFVLESTTRPQENLVVGVGFGIFSFSPQDHKIYHESFQSKKNYIGK